MSVIHDILKANGYNDEEITSIAAALGTNPDHMKVFEQGLVDADEKVRQAQLKLDEANRKNQQIQQWWEQDATKQINDVYTHYDNIKADNAYLKAQVDAARESGFLPGQPPGPAAPDQLPPVRSPDGRFVANANPVPGSPKFMTEEQGWKALASVANAVTRYPQLFEGRPLPDSIPDLVKEAINARMDFDPYISQKYDFPKREKEIAAARQKEHDDKVAKEALDAYKKEFAERNGSNPDLRPGVTSSFSKFQQQQPNGQRDKLSWSRPDAKEKLREYAHQMVAKEQQKVQ
jgi:hypothetical protein